jgi:hypothetical protein
MLSFSAPFGPSRRRSPYPHCPLCYGSLYRLPRRLSDRLISVVVPVRRYCCFSNDCGWEGRLRICGAGDDAVRRYQA